MPRVLYGSSLRGIVVPAVAVDGAGVVVGVVGRQHNLDKSIERFNPVVVGGESNEFPKTVVPAPSSLELSLLLSPLLTSASVLVLVPSTLF